MVIVVEMGLKCSVYGIPGGGGRGGAGVFVWPIALYCFRIPQQEFPQHRRQRSNYKYYTDCWVEHLGLLIRLDAMAELKSYHRATNTTGTDSLCVCLRRLWPNRSHS